MDIILYDSPHHEPRRAGTVPSILLVHYTETPSAQEAVAVFSGKKANENGQKVSVHYMIDEDGTVMQFVDERDRAWHAGMSYWDGQTDINSNSIGIELQNPGERFGARDFPDAQIDALVSLSHDIFSRHPAITPARVLGHSDVAVGRKADPGPRFPWERLAAQGVGLWPAPTPADEEAARAYLASDTALKQALVDYGYDPKQDVKALAQAFSAHFAPGLTPAKLAARLASLLRLKNLAPGSVFGS